MLKKAPLCLRVLRQSGDFARGISGLFFIRGTPLSQRCSFLFHSLFGRTTLRGRIVRTLTGGTSKLAHARVVTATGASSKKTLAGTLQGLYSYSFVHRCATFNGARQNAVCRLASLFALFRLHCMGNCHKRSSGR